MSFFIITGFPGSGKTTLVTEVVEQLTGVDKQGFVTVEIRERGSRQGFDIITLKGRRGPLARVGSGSPRVSKYAVDIPSLEQLGVGVLQEGLQQDASLFVVDEVGKMELLSDRFRNVISQIVDEGRTLLATVPVKSGDSLVQRLKEHPSSEVWHVKKKRFDEINQQVTQGLQQELSE